MIAAGLESLLIFLAFIVISGLSTWLQKRRQGQAEPGGEWDPEDNAPRPPAHRPGTPQAPPNLPPRRPIPAPLQQWEEELRRLLEGDRYRPPEPPPQAAPPPLPSGSRRAQPVPRPQPPVPRQPSAAGQVEPVSARASNLEASQRAYRRAREQQAEATARLREAQAKTARHQAAYQAAAHRVRGGDIRAARALLSRPGSARQAVIASVILAQPKGLE